MAELPPLPDGFELQSKPSASGLPPLPEGFELKNAAATEQPKPFVDRAVGAATDALGNFVKPITTLPKTYTDMVRDAWGRVQSAHKEASEAAREKGPVKDIPEQTLAGGKALLGALDYATAPLAAPVRTFLGNPVAEGVTAATGSKEVGRIAQDMAEIAGGGVLGGGLERGAARATEAVGSALERRAAANASGLSKPALEVIDKTMRADGGYLGARLSDDPQAMLVDADPQLRTVLDTSAQRAGPSAGRARQAVESRAAAANDTLNTALDTTLGGPVGVQTQVRSIREGSQPARHAAYDVAYATPIDYSSENGRHLEEIIARRVPGNVIAAANELMRVEGETSHQIMAHIGDDGRVTFERMPDVRQIDYMTRALNDVAEGEAGKGQLGGTTARGRAYQSLSREMRDTLGEAVPEYGFALRTAALPIRAQNAVRFGAEAMKPNMPRDEVAYKFDAMTEPEKASARNGVRAYLDSLVGNVKRTITDPNLDARQAMAMLKEFSSDAAQEKLAIFLPQSQMRALDKAVERATTALELRASIAANSKTFARLSTDETVKNAAAPGAVARVLQGKPVNAAQRLAQSVTRTRPEDIQKKEEAIYGEIVRALTAQEPEASRILNSLRTLYGTPQSPGFRYAGPSIYPPLAGVGAVQDEPSLGK